MPMVNKTVDTAQVIDINAPGPSGISDDKEDTMPMVNKTVDTAQVIGTNAPGPSGKTDDKDGSASAVRKQRKKRKMLNNLNDELSDYYKPTDKSAKRRNQQK